MGIMFGKISRIIGSLLLGSVSGACADASPNSTAPAQSAMNYRIVETAYGPAIRFHDWAVTRGNLPTDHVFRETRGVWKPGGEGVDALFHAGGHLQLFATAPARVTRRDYLYGGGGDVELVFRFEIERLGADGSLGFHLNGTHRGGGDSGFRVVFTPGLATVYHGTGRVAQTPFDTQPGVPRELAFVTLGNSWEVRLDANRAAGGTFSQESQDNEGWIHLEAEEAGIRLLAFAEHFIVHDKPFPQWRKTELLHEETFGRASWEENWLVNGVEPTVTDQYFLYHPMSNVILNRRFEGPLAVEIEATPMPNDDFSAGLTDAIFIWMMDHPDEDLPDFMRGLPNAARPHYDPVAFYWMDFGGTNNVTTRLRRSPHLRMVRQFTDEPRLLRRDTTYQITLVQNGSTFEFWVNGEPWIQAHDPEPLTSGYLGHRSFNSELKITGFQVWRIEN